MSVVSPKRSFVESLKKIVETARQVLPWSLPIKFVIGAILGALGGAGVLGYLSEYATYSFALYFGFRPPLEGIPYLKATVALGSVFLLMSGVVVFFLSTFLIKAFIWWLELGSKAARYLTNLLHKKFGPTTTQIDRIDFWSVATRLIARPWWQILLFAFFVSLLFATIMFVELRFLPRLNKGTISEATFIAGMGFYGFVVTLAMARPKAIWWLAVSFTVVNFAAWIIVLFTPSHYSSFLRVVGYGGGLPVAMQLRDFSSASEVQGTDLYLMLRTTDTFILFDKPANRFVEVPRDQVRRITYGTGGLQKLPFSMPN